MYICVTLQTKTNIMTHYFKAHYEFGGTKVAAYNQKNLTSVEANSGTNGIYFEDNYDLDSFLFSMHLFKKPNSVVEFVEVITKEQFDADYKKVVDKLNKITTEL